MPSPPVPWPGHLSLTLPSREPAFPSVALHPLGEGLLQLSEGQCGDNSSFSGSMSQLLSALVAKR